jgi:hypothetical protein
LTRNFPDKQSCLKELWLKILPHAGAAGGIDLPGLWYITRQGYPDCADEILEEVSKCKNILFLPKEWLRQETGVWHNRFWQLKRDHERLSILEQELNSIKNRRLYRILECADKLKKLLGRS